MKPQPNIIVVGLLWLAFSTTCGPRAFAIYSGFTNAKGETPFSQKFLRDYELATKNVDDTKSAAPLLALLAKYQQPEEIAELELTLGITYGQRTGLVDPAQAVLHFTKALEYQFPEKTYLAILTWRGNASEQLRNYNDALKDYLRGLLACSYHDVSGGWPEDARPTATFDVRSDDPEDVQRGRDYDQYRQRIDLQRSVLMQRYYLVEAVKRVEARTQLSDDHTLTLLKDLSPDSSRYALILKLLKSENKRPWP